MTTQSNAVVIGGGMAGLFAARVLSEHFDDVLIVDRDSEPVGAKPRPTVPQGNHFHALLPGGLDAMGSWFPGFTDDLVNAGSIPMTVGRDFVVYTPLGRSYSLQSHVTEPADYGLMYVQTRPLLEHCVRTRVRTVPNIRFRHDSIVDGPVHEGRRVTGVKIRNDTPLVADLVVDASGRNSVSARWLGDLGYPSAPETYVNCDVHYASVTVTPENWDAFNEVVFFVTPSGQGEHGSRTAAVVKIDGGRWLIALGGRYGDAPPTNWDAFREFGKTLPYAVWDELVATCTPLESIKTYHLPRAVRRHYEQLDHYPEGLLPIGDSICFFNPTHGQGMSSAAGQCKGLEQLLNDRAVAGRNLDGLAKEFFPIAADWVRGPWILAAVSDFENPACTGDFPMDDLPDLIRLGELSAASANDPALAQFVVSIATLKLPLSAVRTMQSV